MRLSFPAAAIFLASGAAVTSSCNLQRSSTNDIKHAIAVAAVRGTPGFNGIVRGTVMAVEYLNSQPGAKFEVSLPPQDITSPVRLAEYYRGLPNVIAVVGHAESGNSLETIPIYADAENDGLNGLVMVSQMASSPRLSGISPWFFRLAPSDAEAARYAAQWVADSLHAQTAAIIYRNDSYGRDWSGTFAEAFAQSGRKVISRDPYLTGVVEWNAYASLLASQKPDVILFPGDADDCLDLLAALERQGVSIPLVGGDGTEGIARSHLAHNSWVAAFFSTAQLSSEEGARFLSAYRERHGENPDGFAALSYEAAMLIGRTVTAGADTRAALRLALEQIGNQAPSVEGIVGRIAFDRNHDIKGRLIAITSAAPRANRGRDQGSSGAGSP